MRFGLVILPDQRWSEAARRWRQAEAYGFDHAWTYDHLGWRELVDGPWFDAVPTLTAAALVTRKIKLGTFVASPNFRHPVHFAREAMTLDDISRGRLMLGLGAGAPGFDTVVLGWPELPGDARVRRFAEFIEVLALMTSQPKTTWHGDFYVAVEARGAPDPVQQPRPPFVVAANGRKALRLAARFGDGWVTTGALGLAAAEDWWRSVATTAACFNDALDREGRPRDVMPRYLNLDSSPVYSLSSAAAFEYAVERAAGLGFTDVIAHWPRRTQRYVGDEKVLETVAAWLPRLRGR